MVKKTDSVLSSGPSPVKCYRVMGTTQINKERAGVWLTSLFDKGFGGNIQSGQPMQPQRGSARGQFIVILNFRLKKFGKFGLVPRKAQMAQTRQDTGLICEG